MPRVDRVRRACRFGGTRSKPEASLPGLRRLDENVGAAADELTPHDLREIDSAGSNIAVQGYFTSARPVTVASVLWEKRMPYTPSVDLSLPAATMSALG